jgi:N-acetyl-gamma-glutamyl-phosphate reductase
MKKVAVIGAAGYTGLELVRWLIGHPGFELAAVSSDGDAGRLMADVHPGLIARTGLSLVTHQQALAQEGVELAFLAVPHTAAQTMAAQLVARGVAVIDLSADFRLKSSATYEQWYGAPHSCAGLLEEAVYGLPELGRAQLAALAQRHAEHGGPVLVANPGCYPTATLLAIAPALKLGMTDAGILVVNAMSGVSGAGRAPSPTTHFCTADEDLGAYKPLFHRHVPEMAQAASDVAGRPVKVAFTPHLAPLKRGMVSTVTCPLADGWSAEAVQEAYEQAYAQEGFIHVLAYGAMPHCAHVAGGNHAHIGIAVDAASGMLVASCAIDNLGKGASSQAVQNANIICGFAEGEGIDAALPVV